MVEVEDAVVAEAGAVGSVGVEEEWAEDGSDEGADAEGGDAHAVGEKDSAEDDAEVVNEGRDGLEGELFADEENGGEDSAREEEKLCGEENAGDAGAEDALGRGGVEVDAEMRVKRGVKISARRMALPRTMIMVLRMMERARSPSASSLVAR